MKCSKKTLLIAVFVLIAGFLALIVVVLLPFLPINIPTRGDADILIDRLRMEQSYDKRAELIAGSLERLRYAMTYHSVEDLLQYTFSRLEEYFSQERDNAVLEGMDRTTMTGHFACWLSILYYELRNEPEFISRYRENETARDALRRCVGLEWSAEEYYSLVYSGDDSMEIDEEIALEIARGPALRLGYEVLRAKAACTRADNTFTVTFFSESNPDQQEVLVLVDSRNAKVIGITDLRTDSE